MASSREAEFVRRHDLAVLLGRDHYVDPDTGYRVFTAVAHLGRGHCCGNSCRHCPYGQVDVPGERKQLRAWAPTFYPSRAPQQVAALGQPVDVIFWSGGKDSWLAWDTCRREGRRTAWLTTYDAGSLKVPMQDIPIQVIEHQARDAEQDLVLVPTGPGRSYEDSVSEGLDLLARRHPIDRLVFGDLWLNDVRRARERIFGTWLKRHGAELHLPLWGAPMEALLTRLFKEGPSVHISATRIRGVAVGEPYDRMLVDTLPVGVDPMGETGEFHTVVSGRLRAPLEAIAG